MQEMIVIEHAHAAPARGLRGLRAAVRRAAASERGSMPLALMVTMMVLVLSVAVVSVVAWQVAANRAESNARAASWAVDSALNSVAQQIGAQGRYLSNLPDSEPSTWTAGPDNVNLLKGTIADGRAEMPETSGGATQARVTGSNGQSDAWKVTYPASGNSYVRTGIVPQVGQTYTASVWLRASSTRTIRLSVECQGDGAFSCGTGSDATYKAVTVGTTWTRFTNTFTVQAGKNYAYFMLYSLNGDSSSVRDLEYWHPQIEAGSTANEWNKSSTYYRWWIGMSQNATYDTPSGVTGNWRAITYGNGTWVAINDSDTAFTSTDGITWTSRGAMPNAATVDYARITYGLGKFIATTSAASSSVATSADGITWGTATLPASRITFPACSPTVCVFAYASSTTLYRYNTSDLSAFSNVVVGTISSGLSPMGNYYVNNRFFIMRPGAAPYVSAADSATSYSVASTTLTAPEFVGYVNGTYVMVETGTTNSIATSTNGSTWSAGTLPATADWGGLDSSGSRLGLVATSVEDAVTDLYLVTSDASTWDQGYLPGVGSWNLMAGSGSKWLIARAGSTSAYLIPSSVAYVDGGSRVIAVARVQVGGVSTSSSGQYLAATAFVWDQTLKRWTPDEYYGYFDAETYLPPSTPTNFVANIPAGSSTVNLSWDPGANGVTFRLIRVGNSTSMYTGTGTSYSDTSAQAGVTYTYLLYAVNWAGVSSPAKAVGLSAPGAPGWPASPLSPLRGTYGGFTVTWNSVAGASTYTLYRCPTDAVDCAGTGGTALFTGPVLTYDDVPASASGAAAFGKRPYYYVTATNTGGTGPASATTGNTVPPQAITSVTLTPLTAGGMTVAWSASAGASTYTIKRYLVGTPDTLDTSFGTGGTLTGRTGTSYTDNNALTGAAWNQQYKYEVTPVGGGTFTTTGTMSAAAWTYAQNVTLTGTPKSTTAGNDVVVSGLNAVDFTWPCATNGATNYTISRSTDQTNYSLVTTVSVCSGTGTYSDTGLGWNTQYYYRIASVNSAGTNTGNTVSALTVPAAPATMTVTASTSDGTIGISTISWGTVSATGYKVYRSSGGGAYSQTGSTLSGTTTLAAQTGLSANTSYSYFAQAYNATGHGSRSPISSATTLPASTTITATARTNSAGNSQSVADLNAIDLSWPCATNGATSYQIYRTPAFASDPVTISTACSGTGTYADTGLSWNTTYQYTIKTVNGTGSTTGNTASALTVPAAPGSMSVTAYTSSTVGISAISWGTSSGSGYKVYRSSGGAYSLTGSTGSGVTSLSAQTGLTGNTTYSYFAQAYNATGHSNPSSISSALTIPEAPTISACTYTNGASTTTCALTVSVAASGAGGDGVKRLSVNRDGLNQSTSNTNTLSYSATGLSYNTNYTYTAYAYNATGTSPAATSTIKTPPTPVTLTCAGDPYTTGTGTCYWSASSGATGYYLYKNDVLQTTTVCDVTCYSTAIWPRYTSASPLTISGLPDGTTTTYKVVPYNETLDLTGYADTSGLLTVPATVSDLATCLYSSSTAGAGTCTSTNALYSNLRNTWSSKTGATAYHLWVCTDVSATCNDTSLTGKWTLIAVTTSLEVVRTDANAYVATNSYNRFGVVTMNTTGLNVSCDLAVGTIKGRSSVCLDRLSNQDTQWLPKDYGQVTYGADWGQSYAGGGASRGTGDGGYLYSGYFDSTWANQKSLWGPICADLVSDLATAHSLYTYAYPDDLTSNATRSNVAYHKTAHWGYDTGGYLYIGTSARASAPSTWPTADVRRWTADATGGKYQPSRQKLGAWDLYGTIAAGTASGLPAEFRDGVTCSLTLGPGPTTSQEYYNYQTGPGMTYYPRYYIIFRK